MSDRTFDEINVATSLRSDPVVRRAVLACTIGQVFENYDFVLYGFMAAALSRAFFPSGDQVAGLLSTFATFGVGFLMRPVGAFIIGRFGDKYGRRRALVLTIVMMALATGIIGLIPTYAAIGVLAPVALVICRLFQGFAAGGEWGGAAVFLVEYSPQNQRGYISSYQQVGTGLGLLLATLFAALLTRFLDASAFQSWGWRIPFLIGFILGPIGHYLRTRVAETPVFTRHVEARNVSASPIREAFATQRRGLLVIFGISIISVCLYWVFLVFLPTFAARQLHMDPSSTFFSTTLAGVIYVGLTPFMGALSDRIGRKPLLSRSSDRIYRSSLSAIRAAGFLEFGSWLGADPGRRDGGPDALHRCRMCRPVRGVSHPGALHCTLCQLRPLRRHLRRLCAIHCHGTHQRNRQSNCPVLLCDIRRRARIDRGLVRA